MFQVRFHGRGGQGVVTAAEILSVAAFAEGRHAQAFPSFGSERMGAPVVSFCRFDDRDIRTREPVMTPDALVVQDVTLIHQVDLFAGLSQTGYVIINTSRQFGALGFGTFFDRFDQDRLVTCPATEIALERLGRPLPNTVLLGAFAALTGEISLEAIGEAIRMRFVGPVGERNVEAAKRAYEFIMLAKKELSRATPD